MIIAAAGMGLFLPPVGLGVLIACPIAKIDVTSATGALAPFSAVSPDRTFGLNLFPFHHPRPPTDGSAHPIIEDSTGGKE